VCLITGLWLGGAAAAEFPVAARYDGPTERYPHGVLGDRIEYTDLVVTLGDGRSLRTRLAVPLVFEDIAPRLSDLDGDGIAEILTVESHETQGARLAIWHVRTATLRRLIATPHIGTRFRWLAPVGAADLDGDGAVEIAYVDRPHLAQVLRVWRFARADGIVRLTPLASAPGFSNHRIGWDTIAGGIRDCGEGAEMVLASGDWRDTVAVRFEGTELSRRVLAPYSPQAISAALACR
jgi:hypothetical protein